MLSTEAWRTETAGELRSVFAIVNFIRHRTVHCGCELSEAGLEQLQKLWKPNDKCGQWVSDEIIALTSKSILTEADTILPNNRATSFLLNGLSELACGIYEKASEVCGFPSCLDELPS